jgi:hypothetical protein
MKTPQSSKIQQNRTYKQSVQKTMDVLASQKKYQNSAQLHRLNEIRGKLRRV